MASPATTNGQCVGGASTNAEAERKVTLAANNALKKEVQPSDEKPPARDWEDQSGRIQLPPPPKSARLASRQAVMEEKAGESGRRNGKDAVELSANLKSEIASAKAVVWKGSGELIQLPWQTRTHGTILCIDLWSGIGGAVMALLALGVRAIAVALEVDKFCIEISKKNLQNLVHAGDVEKFDVEHLLPMLMKRTISCILIGGGSPCQGNSRCNNGRKNLADVRSRQPQWLADFSSRIQKLAQVVEKQIPVITWLENVGTADTEVLE